MTAHADPLWVPPPGTLHTVFSITGAQWDEFLQSGTASIPLPGEINQFEFTGSVEYTPIENLALDLQIPIVFSQKKFVYLSTDENLQIIGVQTGPNGETRDVSTNAGIGDTVLGAKYIFWEKGLSVGGRLHFKIPGTYDYGTVPNAPGDGQFDAGFTLLLGKYFPSIRSYIRASAGYVLRASDPADQMEFMVEPGINITQRLGARFLYQHTEQFGGTDILYYGYANYFPGNEEESDRIGFGLSYQVTDTFSLFGLFQITIAGRNTADTQAITIGIDFSL